MNTLRNIAKKLIAVSSGAVMLGATIGGAVALDLADYPAPFVKNGQFDALIIVGERASSIDTIGAIDIAGSLQAASTTPVTGGSGTTTTVTGDSAKIGDSGDILEIGEFIGDVTESLTASDLELLKSESITTDQGTTSYTQNLDLSVNTTTTNGRVILGKNDDDKVSDFLFFENKDYAFEYELAFTSGLESEIDSNVLIDIEDESVFMLGRSYSIVNANLEQTEITLELIAGDTTDTMSEGDTKTYTIGGKKYEITILFVSDTAIPTAKFSINGEVTDALAEDDTETMSDGFEIGVRSVLSQSRGATGGTLVEFYLGANKMTIIDTAFGAAGTDTDGSLEINGEDIEDMVLDVDGTNTTSDISIDSITMKLKLDAAAGTNVYLEKGDGLRAMLDEPEGMIGDIDIRYEGLSDPETTNIEFTASSDQYDLTFTNRLGQEYTVAYANTIGNRFGGEDAADAFKFVEINTNGANGTNIADYVIGFENFFVVTDTDGTTDNNDDTIILQFTDVDEDNTEITFEDIATGDVHKDKYSGAVGNGAAVGAYGTITIGGGDYKYWLADAANNEVYTVAFDMDGDDTLEDNSITDIVVKGGGILRPANQTYNATTVNWTAMLRTLDEDLDSFGANLDTNITFLDSGSDIEVSIPTADVEGAYYYESDTDADISYGLTAYGAKFEKVDNTDNPDDLTIAYPSEQVEALVYVTGANVKATTTASGSGSRINPIGVGVAVLDTDVTYDQANMIVVGGPCANDIAAKLMGNPTQCGEGFVAGKGMIKLFDTGANTAILVAGYSAQDTQGASRVLAEYADYTLTGESVDVVVESLTNLKVE